MLKIARRPSYRLGPRRSPSIQSYLLQTRILAAVAGSALAAGIVSDILTPHFWNEHALLGGLTSSFIVVMLTVAVVNEAAEWRSRRRWSVLAQYVMIQLVRHSRMVWMAIAELAGVLSTDAAAMPSMEVAVRAVRDTGQLNFNRVDPGNGR
jgi:hypothetical protein